MKQKVFYFFSAFVCGAAVMAVEMTGSRLLAPYFGTSLFVWTNVIGIILVALALGYHVGGRMADKHPLPQVYFFWIAVTGLWVMGIPFAAAFLLPTFASAFSNLELSLRLGSFLAVLLLLAFPLTLLGMVNPFTVRLTAENIRKVGALSGSVSMISTVGSLVGTFLPALVLIPQLGSTHTFVLVGLCLVALSAVGLRNVWLGLFALLSVSLFWLVPPVYAAENLVAAQESPYGYVFVTQTGEVRHLHVDNALGIQSTYDPSTVLPPSSYYYAYFGVLPALVSEPHSVLILGHAAGTFTRIFNTYYPELDVTGVELDPTVTAMAEKYMGLSDARVTIVHADARQYLRSTEQKFDLILVDAYHAASIPAHLATQEFFELCAQHLNTEGFLALNAASTRGEFLNELKNTVAEPFGAVFSFPIPGSFNTLLLTGDRVLLQGLEAHSVPSDLHSEWEAMAAFEEQGWFFYTENKARFRDEKLSEVELKNETMFMQLLSKFH